MLKLPTNLAALARLASKEAARYALNAVRLEETTDGYQAVATDGRRLAVVTGPGLSEEPAPPLDEAPGGAATALVPSREWGQILKGARRQPAAAVLGKEVTTFAVGGAVSTVPNQEGRFPDVERVAADSCWSLLRVRVNARLLAELLLVAGEFGGQDGRDAEVTLHYGGKGRPLLVTTEGDEG